MTYLFVAYALGVPITMGATAKDFFAQDDEPGGAIVAAIFWPFFCLFVLGFHVRRIVEGK
jgi:hypothetical protein